MKHDIFSLIWVLFAPFTLGVVGAGAGGDGGAGGSGDGGDDGAGDGTGSGDGTGGAGAGSPPPSNDFRAFMDEKGNFVKPEWAAEYPNLGKKFTSVQALAKSYANLERQIGNSNKVAIPSDHSTKEEWDSYYNRLGRPETPDGYELAKPEGLDEKLWSEDEVKDYAGMAHKLGLTKSQAAELAKWQAERIGGAATKHTEALEQLKTEAVTALKKEWGAEYEANVQAAKKGAMIAGGEELVNHPLANDPIFIRAMAKIGAMVKEDGSANLRQGAGIGQDPRAEISAIRGDPKHPYNNGKHPDHERAVMHVASLYSKLNPTEPK